MDHTRNILSKIRQVINENTPKKPAPETYLLTESDESTKEEDKENGNDENHREAIHIKKSDTQFGDIYQSQTEAIKKAVSSNVKFGEDAITYYPGASDMTIDFKIPYLNVTCQYRLNDSSGNGAFMSTENFQMTDENNKVLLKIYDAYRNWCDSINEESDLFNRLDNYASRN